MTIFEFSVCLGIAAALYLIVSASILASRRYRREDELRGRPVTVQTTSRF